VSCRIGELCRSHGTGLAIIVGVAAFAVDAQAHGVADRDSLFLATNEGPAIAAYMYLGAKHMITGIDHLLFLAGVVFFLYRLRDVAVYVTVFAVGHSATLLIGVLSGLHADPFLVDAAIGLSVAYKAFENMGGFRSLGVSPNTKVAVFAFGLCHGFGLATKLQSVTLSSEGLVANILSFNIGVEAGQLFALAAMLIGLTVWRRAGRFTSHAFGANWLLLTAGFVLMGYQLTGYALA